MIRPNRTWRAAAVLGRGSPRAHCLRQRRQRLRRQRSPTAARAPAAKKGDGTLTIGTLLPQTGDLAFLGPPGVRRRADRRRRHQRRRRRRWARTSCRSRPTPVTARPTSRAPQTDKLLDANADVVVGAASSSVSLSVIDKITGAGVVQFSPANTSPALDDAKTDPKDLYFRTAPSDVLQGAVMANTVIGDGNNNVAILARQDSYGELLAEQIEKGIKAGGGNVVDQAALLRRRDELHRRGQQGRGVEARRDRAGRLRRDQEDHPAADRQGRRPAGRADLLRGRQHRRLLEGLRAGHAQGRQGHLPGCRADLGLQGAAAEDRPEAQGLHLRSRVVRRHGADRPGRDLRRSPTTRRPSRREIIKVSEGGTTCTDVQGVRRPGSRRARTSTTTVSPVRSSWARPVARPRRPSASTSTAQDNTYKRPEVHRRRHLRQLSHTRKGPDREVGPLSRVRRRVVRRAQRRSVVAAGQRAEVELDHLGVVGQVLAGAGVGVAALVEHVAAVADLQAAARRSARP